MGPEENREFLDQAQAPRVSLARELWDFLVDNKKWWLLPILISLLALGLLVAAGSSGLAPFIYTLF